MVATVDGATNNPDGLGQPAVISLGADLDPAPGFIMIDAEFAHIELVLIRSSALTFIVW